MKSFSLQFWDYCGYRVVEKVKITHHGPPIGRILPKLNKITKFVTN